MGKRFLGVLAILFSLFVWAGAAEASLVSIANPSFEIGSSTIGLATGWTNIGQSASNANAYNPYEYQGNTALLFSGANSTTDPANGGAGFKGITGEDLAFEYQQAAGTELKQVLSAVLTANTRYTFTVTVGDPSNSPFSGSEIELLAGSTVIAESILNTSPGAGVLKNQTAIVLNSNAYSTLVGDPLTIMLLTTQPLTAGSGQATVWDNVRLVSSAVLVPAAAKVSAVPIPGAIWLLGSSLVGLIGLKRRKVSE